MKNRSKNLLPRFTFATCFKSDRESYNQTKIFLSKNKILYKYQSGFQKSFSTNSCLTLFTDKINKGFESGKYMGLILITYKKLLTK